MQDFYFDDWADLYRKDPAEFEKKRQQVLDAVIARAPLEIRDKLRITQMECDAIRSIYPPLEAAAAISRLMLERLLDLQNSLIDLKISCDNIADQDNR